MFNLVNGVQVHTATEVLLTPANENLLPVKPDSSSAFSLNKVAHNETREGQKELNKLLNEHALVRRKNKWVENPLSAKGGFDGDHIKDLGFGGKDNAQNYWPLAANINRRAFNGYNSHYISQRNLVAKAVGGLIGKYFKVKGYMDDSSDRAVPHESGGVHAGTWDDR